MDLFGENKKIGKLSLETHHHHTGSPAVCSTTTLWESGGFNKEAFPKGRSHPGTVYEVELAKQPDIPLR